MQRSMNDVALRVWTPRGGEVVFLKQVAPHLEDLTDRRTTVDGGAHLGAGRTPSMARVCHRALHSAMLNECHNW
jgi:hypothetical protein